MVATNDDLLAELKKITNLMQGSYYDQETAEAVKLSNDVKKTVKEQQEVAYNKQIDGMNNIT